MALAEAPIPASAESSPISIRTAAWICLAAAVAVGACEGPKMAARVAVKTWPEATRANFLNSPAGWIFGDRALNEGAVASAVQSLPPETMVATTYARFIERFVSETRANPDARMEIYVGYRSAASLTSAYQGGNGERFMPICFSQDGKIVSELMLTGQDARNLVRMMNELSGKAPKSGLANELKPC